MNRFAQEGSSEIAAEARRPSRGIRWSRPFWALLLAVGAGAAAGIVLVDRAPKAPAANATSSPVATWPAGARRAPAFSLIDQNGKPVSLTGLRGRPVVVTFIDPLCRKLCPREARVLSEAVTSFGPARRPAIVAVSVDPWGDSRQNFKLDALHWRLAPGWLWGTGTETQLASVWRRYQIAVEVKKQVFAGVTIRKITHTEAAYAIDGSGHERALLLWPFTAAQAVDAIRTVLPST